jgi:O-antigen/teichoic acid export membrane protein
MADNPSRYDEVESANSSVRPAWTRAWLLDTGVLASSQLLVLAAGWALALAVARELGPADYGVFAVCFSLAQAFAVVVEAGFTTYLLRELSPAWLESEAAATELAGRIGGEAVAFSALLGGALTVLTAVVAVAAGFSGEVTAILLGLITYTVAMTIAFVMEAILRSRRRLRAVAVATLIEKGILVATVVIVLTAGYGLVGVAVAYVAAGAVRLVYDFLILRRSLGVRLARPTRRGMSTNARRAFPFAVNTAVLNLATRADPAVVGAFSRVGAGYFNIGDRVLVSLLFVPVTASSALYPHLAGERDPVSAGWRTALAVGAGGAVIGLALILAAPWLIPFAFGDAYRAAVPVVQLMLVALPLLAFVNTLLATLYSAGFERRIMAGIATAMAGGTVLMVLGAAVDGARGAAACYIVRALFVTFALVRTSRQRD